MSVESLYGISLPLHRGRGTVIASGRVVVVAQAERWVTRTCFLEGDIQSLDPHCWWRGVKVVGEACREKSWLGGMLLV